jgi:CRP/FNR family transcriptional regulator, anaerobic regulatory protein
MLDCPVAHQESSNLAAQPGASHTLPVSRTPVAPAGFEDLVKGVTLHKRILHAKQHVFRAGQAQQSLYLVHAGVFKTSLVAPDGREKITGFRMRGDLLGLDSLGMSNHACDAVSLDVGSVWELPCAQLREQAPEFQDMLTAALAGEIRRDWSWMLAVATLSAEQRVVAFLLDLAARMDRLGYSSRQMLLRMSRTDLGNFLSMQLETVVRALSRLQSLGLIAIDRREIQIQDRLGLQAILNGERALAA